MNDPKLWRGIRIGAVLVKDDGSGEAKLVRWTRSGAVTVRYHSGHEYEITEGELKKRFSPK